MGDRRLGRLATTARQRIQLAFVALVWGCGAVAGVLTILTGVEPRLLFFPVLFGLCYGPFLLPVVRVTEEFELLAETDREQVLADCRGIESPFAWYGRALADDAVVSEDGVEFVFSGIRSETRTGFETSEIGTGSAIEMTSYSDGEPYGAMRITVSESGTYTRVSCEGTTSGRVSLKRLVLTLVKGHYQQQALREQGYEILDGTRSYEV